MTFYFLKSLIFFLISLSIVFSQNNPACEWTHPKSGTSFNFCSLKKDQKY